jgi:hypothetical protein
VYALGICNAKSSNNIAVILLNIGWGYLILKVTSRDDRHRAHMQAFPFNRFNAITPPAAC